MIRKQNHASLAEYTKTKRRSQTQDVNNWVMNSFIVSNSLKLIYRSFHFFNCRQGGGGRFTTLRMTRKPVKLQKESIAGCAGKVNRVKGIRRREKDGLKITDNSII